MTTPTTSTITAPDPTTAARALLSPAALALFEKADLSNDTLSIRIRKDRFQLVTTQAQVVVGEVVCDTAPFTRVYVDTAMQSANNAATSIPNEWPDHSALIGRPIQSPT